MIRFHFRRLMMAFAPLFAADDTPLMLSLFSPFTSRRAPLCLPLLRLFITLILFVTCCYAAALRY